MSNNKFKVLNVSNLSPLDLELKMKKLYEEGYKRIFQSNIEWYQGRGFSGVIVFERKE